MLEYNIAVQDKNYSKVKKEKSYHLHGPLVATVAAGITSGGTQNPRGANESIKLEINRKEG